MKTSTLIGAALGAAAGAIGWRYGAVPIVPAVSLGVVGGAVAGSAVGRRGKKKLTPEQAAIMSKLVGPKIKVPKLAKMGNSRRLELTLKAWLSLAEIFLDQWGPTFAVGDIYYKGIEWPASAYAPGTYGRKHGPKKPGLLYNMVIPEMGGTFSEYGRKLWLDSPTEAVARADELLSYAIGAGISLEEQGETKIVVGPSGASLTDLAEDYARDAAISYLASAVPGGGAVLALADEMGIGWSFSSGPQDVDSAPETLYNRGVALVRADDLITFALANPS